MLNPHCSLKFCRPYSCFEKGCPLKASATIWNGIWDVGFLLLDRSSRCFSVIQRNSINTCIQTSPSFLLRHREFQSSNDELSIPTIQIGIVAYAFKFLSKQLYTATGRAKITRHSSAIHIQKQLWFPATNTTLPTSHRCTPSTVSFPLKSHLTGP